TGANLIASGRVPKMVMMRSVTISPLGRCLQLLPAAESHIAPGRPAELAGGIAPRRRGPALDAGHTRDSRPPAPTVWALDRGPRCIRWYRCDNSFLVPSPDLDERGYVGIQRLAVVQKNAI